MITALSLNSIPTCQQAGSLTLTDDMQNLATQVKAEILANGGYIERQAICISSIHSATSQISYVISDYATIKTLRQQGLKIAALGSGTILCCPHREQIFLQRRSATTDISPNKLGCFGGHYTPDRAGYGFGILLDTLIDEVLEEAGINLMELGIDFAKDLSPIFLIIEPDTGGIQFTPIAFGLTPEQADQILDSEEGQIETYHLTQDLDFLLDEKQWSQMGFACFQTWRELGFPVQKNWKNSA